MIGGGDTGSDCIGTSIRQGAASVTNFEIMPQPPEHENKPMTWPLWPLKLRTSSSHEEGVNRDFAVLTTKFTGANGQVKTLHCARADAKFQPIPGTEFEIEADLVLLAMGFVHPVHDGMIKSLGVELDPRGNVKADQLAYQTSAAEGVRRRRHAPRPVSGGVGDPRGPPVRPLDRQVPDGLDRAAAVTRNQIVSGRTRRSSAPARAAARATGRGRRGAGAAEATGRTSPFGAATVVSGAGCITGIGSVVVATIGSVPTGAMTRRGQAKSSARPAGGVIASPLTSARVTDFGAGRGAAFLPPASSWPADTDAVSGTTGPASGRAAGPLGFAGVAGTRLARRQRHQLGAGRHHAADFTLEIMRKLAGAGLGEMHAVAGAKPPGLAFEVRALGDVSGRCRRQSRPTHRCN